jgi:hypothetical protein
VVPQRPGRRGPAEAGLPWNWPNANTRFATSVQVDGINIRIISRPTQGGVITAFPTGPGDTANLLMAVPPYASQPGQSDD